MDWEQIRQQWQSAGEAAVPQSEEQLLSDVQQRDSTLRSQVRRRDALETVVALLLAPIFGYATWRAGLRGDWLQMFFCVWLTTWVLYVPWHFWRVRRRMPQARPELSLVDYLNGQRDALLAQARMLEQVWIWYLAPCAFGVIGLNLAAAGLSIGTLVYAAVVLAFCVLLDRLNRRAAQVRFRSLAQQFDQLLFRLSEEHDA